LFNFEKLEQFAEVLNLTSMCNL